MNGVVTFNYGTWATRYPELASYVPSNVAQLFFNEATLYTDNTSSSPIQDSSVGGQREMILYMATAHIAKLNASNGSIPAPDTVGRINTATQGSVSVGLENNYAPGSAQWWQQTKYGAAWWAATAAFRKFRYASGYRRNMDPYSPFH